MQEDAELRDDDPARLVGKVLLAQQLTAHGAGFRAATLHRNVRPREAGPLHRTSF